MDTLAPAAIKSVTSLWSERLVRKDVPWPLDSPYGRDVRATSS